MAAEEMAEGISEDIKEGNGETYIYKIGIHGNRFCARYRFGESVLILATAHRNNPEALTEVTLRGRDAVHVKRWLLNLEEF
jgi:predicted MarR family transcription regulator